MIPQQSLSSYWGCFLEPSLILKMKFFVCSEVHASVVFTSFQFFFATLKLPSLFSKTPFSPPNPPKLVPLDRACVQKYSIKIWGQGASFKLPKQGSSHHLGASSTSTRTKAKPARSNHEPCNGLCKLANGCAIKAQAKAKAKQTSSL